MGAHERRYSLFRSRACNYFKFSSHVFRATNILLICGGLSAPLWFKAHFGDPDTSIEFVLFALALFLMFLLGYLALLFHRLAIDYKSLAFLKSGNITCSSDSLVSKQMSGQFTLILRHFQSEAKIRFDRQQVSGAAGGHGYIKTSSREALWNYLIQFPKNVVFASNLLSPIRRSKQIILYDDPNWLDKIEAAVAHSGFTIMYIAAISDSIMKEVAVCNSHHQKCVFIIDESVSSAVDNKIDAKERAFVFDGISEHSSSELSGRLVKGRTLDKPSDSISVEEFLRRHGEWCCFEGK